MSAGPGALPELGYNAETVMVVVQVTEHWVVGVVPQAYNDRVLLCSHEEWRTSWTAGFCYDRGPAAMLAAAAWDPEREWFPVGFKKVAGDARGTLPLDALRPEGKELTEDEVRRINAWVRDRIRA